MGYTTNFDGRFKLDRTLTPEHKAYLKAFAETRRMKRDGGITKGRPDPVREAVGLPVGVEGEYFVSEGGFHGQGDWGWGPEGIKQRADLGVLDNSHAPCTQPGLWCQWTPSECGNYIEWDGGEKFYDYVDWLDYIIENFLKPWGYKLNGEVAYQGEENSDQGKIYCLSNRIVTKLSPLDRLAMADVTDWEEATIPENAYNY